MIFQLFTNPLSFLAGVIALLAAITVHEFAHAWSAFKLGDPTAKYEGRLTLNPIAHLDPIGTLMLLLAGFGWGKPIPVNPLNFARPRQDQALTALSGAFANFIVAIVVSLFLKLPLGAGGLILEIFLGPTILLNISLGLFNLLPIFPLDGFAVVAGFLPRNLADQWEDLKQYGPYLLIFSLLPVFGGTSLVRLIISPLIRVFINLLF